MVQTVTGPVLAEQLGHCQMHEHLWVAKGPAALENPALCIDDPERSAAELADYRRAGGCTVLDAQPAGAGRNAAVLRRISEASGVRIVAVTGFHLPKFYAPDHWSVCEDEEALFDRFVRELREGCEEAPQIRAGAVKAALDGDGCRGRTEQRFRAAARAAAAVGVPLVVHTERGIGAQRAIGIAAELGVSPGRQIICHVDRQADDYSVHEAVARTGAVLEYDTIGRFKYHDDASEIRLIRHMLDRGCERQMLLSLDTTRERLARYGGAIGLTYLLEAFLPALRSAGVSERTIHEITVNNPRRIFA